MRWKKQQNFRKKDWPFAYHTGRGKKKIQVKSLLAGSPSTPAEKAELYNTEKYTCSRSSGSQHTGFAASSSTDLFKASPVIS